MKTLLFTLTFAAALHSHAKILSFNTVDFNNKLTSEEASFNDDLAKVAKNIDAFKIAPANIHAIITPYGNNAGFDYGTNIYIPRSMQFTNDWGADIVYKTTMDVVAVFSHEYGHAVFDDLLGRILPVHRQLKAIKAEISALDLKRIQSPLNDEERKTIFELMKQKEESITQNKEFIRVAVLAMPYGELFADAIAVFERDSKGAIFEALYDPNISKARNPMAYEYLAARDFSQLHELEKWTIDEPHVLFSPLRSVIGSEECWPTTNEDRAKKLKGLARMLLTDIIEKDRAKAKATIADNKSLMEKYKALCK